MRLDDTFAIMLDVARLATRGSDAARIEAQRVAGERGSRAATNALAVANQPTGSGLSRPKPVGGGVIAAITGRMQ